MKLVDPRVERIGVHEERELCSERMLGGGGASLGWLERGSAAERRRARALHVELVLHRVALRERARLRRLERGRQLADAGLCCREFVSRERELELRRAGRMHSDAASQGCGRLSVGLYLDSAAVQRRRLLLVQVSGDRVVPRRGGRGAAAGHCVA